MEITVIRKIKELQEKPTWSSLLTHSPSTLDAQPTTARNLCLEIGGISDVCWSSQMCTYVVEAFARNMCCILLTFHRCHCDWRHEVILNANKEHTTLLVVSISTMAPQRNIVGLDLITFYFSRQEQRIVLRPRSLYVILRFANDTLRKVGFYHIFIPF